MFAAGSRCADVIAGQQLTFQVQLIGARAWSFGYEGQHRSLITIIPAPLPPTGLEFGVHITNPEEGEAVPSGEVMAVGAASFPNLGSTEAGDHPTRNRVEWQVVPEGNQVSAQGWHALLAQIRALLATRSRELDKQSNNYCARIDKRSSRRVIRIETLPPPSSLWDSGNQMCVV